MLFNSFEFIFGFLPLIVIAFAFVQKRNDLALGILLLGSLLFYADHSARDLFILIASILVNYAIARHVHQSKKNLFLALAFNLSLLGYFKYAFFVSENIGNILGVSFDLHKSALPLGISFFTFQQIAYLVDTYKYGQPEKNLTPYALLVSFFPHSIAGPLVQYREILPQLKNARITTANLSVGVTIFIIGLFKKVVIADTLAPGANLVFDGVSAGTAPDFLEAWIGTLCYTFQLYFDFSGYSDMALGLAGIFGVAFPINFNSPYKATSVIDFWRRWHMTLSWFLKNYVYIPLGGSRYGKINKYKNLFITMLLCGLWHGAGWTFILWGGLHGIFLVINHAWSALKLKTPVMLGWILTFGCVVMGWVLFRSNDIPAALSIYKAMLGLGSGGIGKMQDIMAFIPALLIAVFIAIALPNIKFFMRDFLKTPDQGKNTPSSVISLSWSPSVFYAFCSAVMAVCVLLCLLAKKEMAFLYFNF